MNDVAVIGQNAVAAYSVDEVWAQVQQVQMLMEKVMKEGTHYGKSFPGDTKKNLLKPGADKLMFTFRLRPDFTQEIKELPNGHREVITQCKVFHIESGNKIAEGVGSASTMESKFRWRYLNRKCPKCGKETIIKGKEEYGGGWICHKKKDGCGAKFGDNDPAITSQQVGKIENPDIADCYNTVLKMSKKRSYVDATITATAASDIFTQDLDDLNGHENGQEEHNVTPENLAHEAVRDDREPLDGEEDGKGNVHTEPDQQSLLASIKDIVFALDPDDLPYFTDSEKDMEKAIVEGAADIKALKNQNERLKKELEKRRAAFKPIPFNTPSMYTEKENETSADNGEIDTF